MKLTLLYFTFNQLSVSQIAEESLEEHALHLTNVFVTRVTVGPHVISVSQCDIKH